MKITKQMLENTNWYAILKNEISLLPEEIIIDDSEVEDVSEVISEFLNLAIYEDLGDYYSNEIITFSPYHPDPTRNPLIIDSKGYEQWSEYWVNKKLKDIIQSRMYSIFLLERYGIIEILDHPIEWVPDDYFGVVEIGEFQIKLDLDLLRILNEAIKIVLPNFILNTQPKEFISDSLITIGSFNLDFKKCQIIFKEKILDINPETQPIKLLILLLTNKDSIRYSEIAKELKINNFKINEVDSDVYRDIHYIKRDLTKVLKNAGLDTNSINILIRTIPKLGFKINKSVLI